jgi:hypothetical protein
VIHFSHLHMKTQTEWARLATLFAPGWRAAKPLPVPVLTSQQRPHYAFWRLRYSGAVFHDEYGRKSSANARVGDIRGIPP